jgi:hypothetical protein
VAPIATTKPSAATATMKKRRSASMRPLNRCSAKVG